MLQHHKDSLRTVGAPKHEYHYPICYCDGQVVITDNYIWDITKHERRYSCGNEIGEMSSAFPVKDDIILSCNQYGDVTLWDPSRAQPVIKRWEGCISHGGRHPKLHVYSCTASTIRFLSYSYTGPVGITLQLWAITNLDTLSLPHRYTAGDSGPRLHQIAAGQIQMKSEPSIDAVYHEYLADSNGEEAVFYLECGRRYRGVHKWSAAQATVSEPLVKEDGSGPVHIDFKEIPYVWEDELAEYPIASDGLFRMSEDRRWVLDSRRRKRLWLPPGYTSRQAGGTSDPEELHCAHGSTFAIQQDGILKTLVDFSCTNLDDSVLF